MIRTMYDHIDEVNCVAFHPRDQILASGGSDFTLKFFDFSKTAVKRACRTIIVSTRLTFFTPHDTNEGRRQK